MWDRIPREPTGEIANVVDVAPDWTIEILSPSQSQTKVIKNILHCLQHGAQMGWLIDPDELTVFIYRPQQEVEVYEQPADRLPMPAFASELQLTLENIFAWLLA